MGGRITLINSVLASLPLYYFSFFKVPKKVAKEMVQIQRNFLWGGKGEVRKMAWVSWDKTCAPKNCGGLGIKNMEMFNLALLGKWRWRILTEKDSEWCKLLERLYGKERILNNKQTSIWWRDISGLDAGNEAIRGWYTKSVKLKLGDGKQVKFWQDKWCGPWQLSELFPRIFAAAEDQNITVDGAGQWIGDCWKWRWSFRTQLEAEDSEELRLLEETLVSIYPDKSKEDRWLWMEDKSMKYSVKSALQLLTASLGHSVTDEIELKVLRRLWNTAAPSKYLVHAWRLFRNGLPTRAALQHRGVLNQSHGTSCVFCSSAEEDEDHLFFSCCFAAQCWQHLLHWCGTSMRTFNNKRQHFLDHALSAGSCRTKKMKHLIWVAIIWAIWIHRNNIIFRGICYK